MQKRMKTLAIICEYNPFHNGHAYQIEKHRKELSADFVLCIMSGNFVQRAYPAVYDKWTRAYTAILGGADLVIELPVFYATQSAERFAKGAVSILDLLGCVDFLSFGSECGDISMLCEMAQILEKEETKNNILEVLKSGVSYPKAVAQTLGENGALLNGANNILALEYIKALNALKSKIEPVTLKRFGSGHGDMEAVGNFASASAIRSMMSEGTPFEKYMPKDCFCALKNSRPCMKSDVFDNLITYLLRTTDAEKIKNIADVSEGIENRLKEAAFRYNTAEEIAEHVKTKRYTRARIDRIILNLLLGITKDDIDKQCSYARVLAFNDKGRQLMKAIKKNSSVTVITKTADAELKTDDDREMFSEDIYATDIYSLLYPNMIGKEAGLDYKKSPVIVKE